MDQLQGEDALLPRFGANYTPRRGWFHSWDDLDLGQIREDVQALAELGLDHLRIFPLWPTLQPNRTLIRSAAIADVLAVADVIGEAGLDVSVDLLQGHLSSFDFLPAWVSTWHRRGLFTDPDVIDAQHQLARALAAPLAERPHVLGLTLGNEIGQFAAPRHPDTYVTSTDEAYRWNRDLLATLEQVFPRGRHQHCFDDNLWFVDDHPFTPAAAVQLGAETTVHSWVFGGAAQRFGIDAPELHLFGRYLLEIADMWHHHLDVPAERTVWLQEIGAPTPWVSPDRAAEFLTGSVRAALGFPRLSAVTWWCSHDVSRELADFPEVEYTLGLIDADGEVKPAGAAMRDLIREVRAERPVDHAHTDAPAGAHAGTDAPAVAGVTSAAAPGPTDAPVGPEPLLVLGLARDGSNRSITDTASDVFGRWMADALDGVIRPLRAAD